MAELERDPRKSDFHHSDFPLIPQSHSERWGPLFQETKYIHIKYLEKGFGGMQIWGAHREQDLKADYSHPVISTLEIYPKKETLKIVDEFMHRDVKQRCYL